MNKFTADPHLSHESIIKFERTRFNTIEEHDAFIKNLISKSVTKNDTLYVLGDVGDLTPENIQFWKDLPCKTILIRGNHDVQKTKLEQAFDIVSDVPIFYNKRILLSHEPLPVTNETLNIHGHLHGAKLKSNNHKNLSIHVNHYQLWTEKDIKNFLTNTPKIAQDFMFEWYAEYYDFLIKNADVKFDKGNNIDLLKSRLRQLTKESGSKIQNILQKKVKQFKEQYPTYPSDMVDTLVGVYMLENYQNNTSFTPLDVLTWANDKHADLKLRAVVESAISELKKEPIYKLCYVETYDSDLHELWFADCEPELVTGDDWDDTPYEHNAGQPYDINTKKEKVTFKKVALTGVNIQSPCSYVLNSPYSANDINMKKTPWLTIGCNPNTQIQVYAGITFKDLHVKLKLSNQYYSLYKLYDERP